MAAATQSQPLKARCTPALERVLAQEKAYRESRKDWRHADSFFASHRPRFDPPRKAAPGDYAVPLDTLGDVAAAHGDMKKVRPSAWARDKAPQIAPPPKPAVDKQYDIPSTFALPAKARGRPSAVFASHTPRDASADPAFAAASNTARAQTPVAVSRQASAAGTAASAAAAAAADGAKKRAGSAEPRPRGPAEWPSAVMRCGVPRFADPKFATTATYDTSAFGTMAGRFADPKKVRPSPWTRPSTVAKAARPVLTPAATPRTVKDDEKAAAAVTRFRPVPAVTAPFRDRSARFPTPRAEAPPPGAYTPDYWSSGMVPV